MIPIRSIIEGWNRFFFRPESPLPIAVYRILLGLLLLANHALLFPDLEVWFGEKGILSTETARQLAGGQGLNLFKWISGSDLSIWLVYWVAVLSALTLTLGLGTRASAIVAFLCLATLHHRNPILLNSGDSFLRIGLFFVIFSHAGAALSLDRLIRVRRGREAAEPAARPPWAMRLIQLQLSFVYLYAVVSKMMGTAWIQGTAVYYTARLTEFWRFPLPYIFEHMWTVKLWTWSTLGIEFALAVLIWVRELRYWVLLGGVLLHAGIDYTMNIPLFGFIMISAYVTFVEPKYIQRVLALMRRKAARLPGLKRLSSPRAVAAPPAEAELKA